jgi:two-component system response regulator VicR
MQARKTKILYVEDEPFLGKIVRESLESRGYEVVMVADGGKVLSCFEESRPDICVLDVMLPNVDGFTLGKEIRKRENKVPILFLTAKNQTEDLLEGFKSGGNDYIRKPFSMEELIVRVENLLEIMKQQKGVVEKNDLITFGTYAYHTQKYELRRADRVKKLSHREAQLLQILLDHQNRAVERKKILKEIWGDDGFFNSRNLDVYITKLRDYLKEDPDIEIITLKGIGYHFSVS